MWELGTPMLAVAVVTVSALVLPPVARGVGGACAIIGLLGLMQGRTLAPTATALGTRAWLIGHWSFAVRNDARYRSRLARVVIDQTPLRWTLPQYWELRKHRRAMVER